jgi:hypothetical protein
MWPPFQWFIFSPMMCVCVCVYIYIYQNEYRSAIDLIKTYLVDTAAIPVEVL